MLISQPSAARRGRFTATKRRNPCEICGDITGKCRQIDDLHLCMNTDSGDAPAGFKFIGRTKDQLWSKFVVDDGHTLNREREFGVPLRQPRQSRHELQRQFRPPALSAPVRDRAYRQLLDSLTLHPDDRADLHRRGLTDAQIAAWGVKSVEQWQSLDFALPIALPGVSADGFHLNCQPGYLCPIYNADEQIVGFQIRLRINDDGRYRWFTSATKKNPNGATPHLPNGELPIAVHRPDEIRRRAIALVEGVGAKLFHHRPLVKDKPWLEPQSGQFASSPENPENHDRHSG